MKMKDLKIGTQLRLGMAAILLFVALLGATAWFQADSLWQETKGLYEHPLTVRRALHELTIDLNAMHRGMYDLVLIENEQVRQSIIQSIDSHEADAKRQFDILYDRYLGSRSDIDDAYNDFIRWESIRDETIRILRDGKTDEAINRVKRSGYGGSHVEKLFAHIKKFSDFALNRTDQFYLESQKKEQALIRQLGIVFGVIFLLTISVSYLLLKGIRKPLQELTSVAERFHHGELGVRSSYTSANEFGTLSAEFNALAETVQTEWQSKEYTDKIASAMLVEKDLSAFTRELIKTLVENTGSQIGAVYLLNEHKTDFEHFESIGLAPRGRAGFSAAGLEGEFGLALATKKIQRISDIQAESIFTFITAGGDFQPREIITIPVSGDDGEIVAIISLAGIRSYSAQAIRLVNDVWSLITARMNVVLAFEKIRSFTEQLEQQNEELQAQQEELETQAEELRKQSEELQGQNVELEQQGMALEESSRLKSQFLSNMSHELRTPLNSVMALSRVLMMQTGTKLNDEEINYLQIIERNGKNLLRLINDILDLSKIEAGMMDVNPKPFSLSQTLENIVESIRPIAGEKQIEINLNIPDDIPPIESDEIRVSQILQNLIGNAVKYSNAGSVSVSMQRDGNNVSTQITDTGIGIAEKDLPYIFDEFRQVDGSSSRKHEGTGLGLAIAGKAAQMLGGKITVESTLGIGSTFILILPVAWKGKATVYEPIFAGHQARVKSVRKTILVVDDEPDMATIISRYLLQEGYNTLTATSGAEALNLAAREAPFAITLDVIMPDMDGWEVLQGLKKNPETKDIPVIIVSISQDKETGFALGAIGYVSKPVSKKQLVSEIRKIGRPETRSIMIVEDNDFERQEIRLIVEGEGGKAILAEDGAACLELIEKQIPDILILDLMMPEPDGFAVLERIRINPDTRDLPVIIVTAKDLTEADRNRLRGNVSSVLSKNTSTSANLLAEIKRILMDLEDVPKRLMSEKPATPPRVLIVDDNDAVIIQIKTVLESAGYVTDVARSGQEGFDYISHTIPDGIVLDLMMPGIDGFEVLEKIRSTKATEKIPVLILTAKDLTPKDLKRLSANNIQQLVQKGDVNKEELLSKIGEMLGISEPQMRFNGSVRKETTSRNAETQLTPKAGGISRILIIEDNPDNMATIKAVFQSRYRILEATDGEEGLRVAAEATPDLILLDMAMPKMDGFAVIRHLKDNLNLKKIPVIAMTARAMKGDREKILEAGCNDYIAKPIDPEAFLKKVGEWLKV